VLRKFVKFNSSDSMQSLKTKEPQAEDEEPAISTEVVGTKIDQLLVLLLLLLLAPLDYRPTALTRSSRASILQGLFQSQKNIYDFFLFYFYFNRSTQDRRLHLHLLGLSVHW
jgi:hypothetical protein